VVVGKKIETECRPSVGQVVIERNPPPLLTMSAAITTTAIPAATAVATAAATAPVPMDIKDLLEQVKLLNASDLAKVVKAAASQIEKVAKSAAKPVRGAKKDTKKSATSSNRGLQLEKPRAWVKFVLEHAQKNGWDAFSITQNKNDKISGNKTQEIIEMPASELVDGKHCFAGSEGKTMIPKHAMSLSKIYWSVKDQTGIKPELYEQFSKQYVPSTPTTSDVSDTSDAEETSAPSAAATPAPAVTAASAPAAKKPVVKKTVAKKN